MYDQIKLTRQNIHNIVCTYTEQLNLNTTDMLFNKFSVINDEEIIKAIKALKDDSSPGLDGISVKMLKLNIHSLIKPLSHIFNLAIATSTILECFKISVIIPIHKKVDKSNIEHYCPISQISNIVKSFEKIIKKELVHYLESNNFLSCTRFGFRLGKSTEQAIATVSSYIYNSFENKKKCATVYLDLAKAFDTIDHKILLKNVNTLGINGTAQNLLSSYLRNRKQYVRINNELSEETSIICVVPQGTTLSPTLFNIHINQINNLNTHGKLVCYADDTVLFVEGQSWNEVFTSVQSDMSKIQK